MEILPARDLQRIRRSRRRPRPVQWDYLHLRRLVDDLAAIFARLDGPVSEVLDVWCGTRPYEDLLPPGARVTGLDIDNRFGAADVVSEEFLPFEDDSFDLVLCIEAFYYVADPAHAVGEMRRVLRPGGTVVLAVPYAWEYDRTVLEQRWTGPGLESAFSGWDEVNVLENGGRGVTWAALTGRIMNLRQKSLPRWARVATRPLFAGAYLAVNGVGSLIERGERRRQGDSVGLPMNLTLTARRPV